MQIKQKDTSTHLGEWLKSKELAMPIICENASNRNYYSLVASMKNGTTMLEDSVVVSYKAKCSTFSHCAPRYLTK